MRTTLPLTQLRQITCAYFGFTIRHIEGGMMTTKLEQAKESKITQSHIAQRVIREYEIVKSDRIELIEQAVRIAGIIMNKQMIPSTRCEFPVVEPTLDGPERQARDAALLFLARQFEQGYSLGETVEKKVELHYDPKRPST